MLQPIRSPWILLSFLACLSHPCSAFTDDSISGRWKFSIQIEEQIKEYDLVLEQDGNKFSGELITPRGGRKDAFEGGSIEGGWLKFEVKLEAGEACACELEKKSAWKFEGKLLVSGRSPFPAVITRAISRDAVVGRWSVVSINTDGKEFPSTLELAEKSGVLTGTSTSRELGTIVLEKVSFDGEKLEFELTLPIEGNKVSFRIVAELRKPDKLEGRWKTRDADFSGDWTATREVSPVAASPAGKTVQPLVAKALSGKWHAIAETPGGKKAIVIELALDGEKVSGKTHTSRGAAELKGGKVAGKKVEFSFLYKMDEGEVEVKVEAELQEDGVLKGSWSIPGGAGGSFLGMKPVLL